MGHGKEGYRISTDGQDTQTGADRELFSSGVLLRGEAMGHRVLEHSEAAESGSSFGPAHRQSTLR
jgi:hypothetical protein